MTGRITDRWDVGLGRTLDWWDANWEGFQVGEVALQGGALDLIGWAGKGYVLSYSFAVQVGTLDEKILDWVRVGHFTGMGTN
jgi:hypothetical protein